jgi:hypothetical protein
MKRKNTLAFYHQGPKALIQVWTTLLHQIDYLQARVEKLEARIAVLESQGKKTPKTAINRLPPMSFTSQSRKAFGLQRDENQAGKKDIPAIHYML